MISQIGHIRRIPQPSDKQAVSDKVSGWVWSGIWVYGTLPQGQLLEEDVVITKEAESATSMEEQQSKTQPIDAEATPQHAADVTKQKAHGHTAASSSSSSSKGTTAIHTSSRFGSVSTSWLQKVPGSRPFLYKFQEHVEPCHVLIPSANYYTAATTMKTFGDVDKESPHKEEGLKKEQPCESTDASDMKPDDVVKPDDPVNPDNPMNNLDNPVTALKEHEIDAKAIINPVGMAGTTQRNHIVKKEEEITFAALDPGESYTDAGIQYPNRSPVGGCWKGYFENESKRKDRNTSHVAEIFYLFFNSSPSSSARVAFPQEDEEESDDEGGNNHDKNSMTTNQDTQVQVSIKKSKDGEPLESGLMHVRGSGSNGFGVFEILGSFNVETGMLRCQRIYVFTTSDLEGPFVSVTDHRQVRKLRLLTQDCPSSLLAEEPSERNKPITISSESKSYFTRKRPVSFKRYNASESENEEGQTRKRSSSMEPPRKKFKTVGDLKSNLFSSSFQGGDSKRQRVPSFSDGALRKLSTAADVADSADSSISQFQMDGRSSPLASENSASVQRKKQVSSKVKNVTSSIVLPSAGDPKMARWKSAHFLYYQKIQVPPPVNDMPSNSSSSFLSKTSTVNFVVYEGEMYNDMRDGIGVCSYNNYFIYEGQWKNNKEHGFGTLMTSDRSRTIYTGEWERGKMNGKGTYNYYVSTIETIDDGNVSDTLKVGVYEGDFRENSRSGVGKYTFPDSSYYFGDWMNNIPSGRGIFQWLDGSTYEGMWRDGKRHGQGLLKASDGFLYDGQWVNNAMEGRGIAIYPHGTRYEGSWLGGKREGRGTLTFSEGAIYEGRFKDDNMDGQGTLQLGRNIIVPSIMVENIMHTVDSADCIIEKDSLSSNELKEDWMIPIAFQSDISSIHQKAGFTHGGD